MLRASRTYFGDLLRSPHNEMVHRKTQHASGINTIPYKLATSLTFEKLCVWGRGNDVGMSVPVSATRFIYLFRVLLRCPHKRIVTITKVYIARKNIHVEIIRFCKN